MTQGKVIGDGPTFEVFRNRGILESAHLLPPQIVDISLQLGDLEAADGSREALIASSSIARADTLDQMSSAIYGFISEHSGVGAFPSLGSNEGLGA